MAKSPLKLKELDEVVTSTLMPSLVVAVNPEMPSPAVLIVALGVRVLVLFCPEEFSTWYSTLMGDVGGFISIPDADVIASVVNMGLFMTVIFMAVVGLKAHTKDPGL